MAITAIRESAREIRVDDKIFVFADEQAAKDFQVCLGEGDVDTCCANHKPQDVRTIAKPVFEDRREGADNNVNSPSLGGMP